MSTAPPPSHTRFGVVVVGGGVAALETCLALHALGGERIHVTLVAPNRYFTHRPVGMRDPLAVHSLDRVPLARVARAAGADLHHDRVRTVDPEARHAYTEQGYAFAYDALVLAIGAVPQRVPTGATAFDEDHTDASRMVIRRLRRGHLASLAFVEPPAPAHALALYDLALQTAVMLRHDRIEAALTLVTSQPVPLSILGPRVAGAVALTLRTHGLRIADPGHVRSIGDGYVELAPGGRRIAAQAVLAVPRLVGPRPVHVPCDADGFLPVDPYGRVPGVDGVFAAGECTSFPVKHPSLAAEQAVAVASTIAAESGLPVTPVPFKPVLRCMLPSRLRWYVEAPVAGGLGDATCVSPHPLWSPNVRFGARFLGPYLSCQAADKRFATVSAPAAPTLTR